MKDFRIILPTLALLWACGCSVPPVINPEPPAPVVDPVPIPIPPRPDPVIPPVVNPTPVTNVIPWDKVKQFTTGMTRTQLVVLFGEPVGDRDQRDGSRILRWAAVNEVGVPKWMDVQVEGDVALGRALWKR